MKAIVRISLKADIAAGTGKDLAAYSAISENLTKATDAFVTALGISGDDVTVTATPVKVRD